MKNFLLQLSFILLANIIHAQAVSWELSAEPGDQFSNLASFQSSNFVNCQLTRGAGVNASTGTGSMNASAWFSGSSPTTLANAIAGNDYYEFTCNTTNCLFFNPTTIKIVLRSSATGPNTATLRCSSDGFATDIGTVTIGTTSTVFTFSETLSPNSQSVTYRLYGYGAAAGGGTPSAGGTMRIGSSVVASDNDIELFGSTTFSGVVSVSNITVTSGNFVPATVFTANVPGATVNWTRTPESIGLGATSGTGDLPAFTSFNNTGAPVTSTVSVTATSGSCTGPATTFTITVNPALCDILNINFLGNPSACDDNGTPNDPSDDFFTQNLQASFINRPTTGNFQVLPGGDEIGTYSIPVIQIIGNSHTFNAVKFKADGTPTVITMNFTDNPGCSETQTGPTIAFCSTPPPPCDILNVNFLGNPSACNDNGTPSDASDDFFTQNLQAAFINRPVTGNLQVLPGGDEIGTYSIPVNQIIGNSHIFNGVKFKADGTPTVVTLNFTADPGCSETKTGPTIASCSSAAASCEVIGFSFANIDPCNDNGTPGDPSDDFFTVDVDMLYSNSAAGRTLRLSGADVVNIVTANAAIGTNLTFTFTNVKLRASGQITNFIGQIGVVSGGFTTECTSPGTGPAVNSCSSAQGTCSISSVNLQNAGPCNDNGTGDPTDDYFTANVVVVFSNPPATGNLEIEMTGDALPGGGATSVPVAGLSSPHTFTGVRFKADGTTTVIEVDFTANQACVRTATAAAVSPCSIPCSVNSVNLQNASGCNDNGTSDPSDDYFTANVVVSFTSPPATGNLEIELPGDVVPGGGATSVPVAGLSSPHTFTGVRFKADGTVTAIEVDFTADQSCVRTSTAAAVQPCSFTPPVLTCPAAVTISCADQAPAVNPASVSETHACPGTVTITHLSDVNSNVFCINKLTITRTYQGTDQCAHVVTCSQTITINDQTPPTVTCPVFVTVSCASQVPATDLNSVGVTDNCSGQLGISRSFLGDVTTNQTCANRFTLTRTYRGGDACGNTATCTQTITVNDQTPPNLICPAAQTVSCAGNVPAQNIALVTGLSDNCSGATPAVTFVNDVISNQTCANRFTLTRTYRATDACTNSATCAQIITVNDQTAPALTCPAGQTVSCAENLPAPNTALVTGVSDNCSGAAPTVAFVNDVISNQTCANRFTVTRTYRATDACGNSATCAQTLTVNDQTPPVFTSVPPNVTVDCYLVPPVGIATASDNCTSGATVAFLGEVKTPGICPVFYILTRTWRATDVCGNSATAVQVVTVTDTNAPQFIVAPANTIVECGPDNLSQLQNFIDTRSGAVVEDCAQITYSYSDSPIQYNGYDCGNTFRKNIRFFATDECGNVSYRDASFSVEDLTPPVFSTPPQNVEIECDVPDGNAEIDFYDWLDHDAYLVAEDNCGNVELEKVLISSSTGCGNTWQKTYEFRATDECGNISKTTATFAVVDHTPPTIICLPNDNVFLSCQEDVPAADDAMPLATDCSGATVALTNTWTNGTACPNWTMTVAYQYTATDACGNETVCERAYYVKETDTPTLVCPDTIKLTCVDDIPGPQQLFGYINNQLAGNCAGGFTGIAIVSDSGVPQNGATHRNYTITAKNHCGLFTSSCTVTFLATGTCNPLCTASQASWGDPGGTIGNMNATDAITQLIQTYGAVTAGGGNHTVSAPDAACVQELLFGSGNTGFLPTGNYSCALPVSLSNPDGSLNNQLAANALALQLNIWYNLKFNNRNLGVQTFNDLPPCLIEFPLLKDLGQNNTVQDLLNLANLYLQGAGYYGPGVPDMINSALDNLNYFRVDCQPNAPCERPAEPIKNRGKESTPQTAMRMFPNPGTDAVTLEFWSEDSEEMVLKIADTGGRVSARNVQTLKGLNSVGISLKSLPAGIYWVSLQSGAGLQTLRLVKVVE